MKYKQFNDGLLNMSLFFITDCTAVEREKYLSKKYKGLSGDEVSGQFGAMTATLEKKLPSGAIYTNYVIWVDDRKDFYALLHEVVHLTKRVFTDRGIPFNETNDEMMAYWIEHWFKVLWRFSNKK